MLPKRMAIATIIIRQRNRHEHYLHHTSTQGGNVPDPLALQSLIENPEADFLLLY